MAVGFIGLGNVGAKLAGSLLRNGVELVVRDLDETAAAALVEAGASFGASPLRTSLLLRWYSSLNLFCRAFQSSSKGRSCGLPSM